jgi:phosphate transport system substrate-binding protein
MYSQAQEASVKKVLILLAFLVPSALAQEILIDGSSTVYPITLAVAEEFNIDNPDTPATVAFSGTGGGFEKFCAGETVINNASRPIRQEEIDACTANNVEYLELEVALDALTVVVNPENDWAQCVTMDQLKGMWQPEATINNWSDVNPDWPAEPIVLYGPGVDSGTFDYFTEAVVGEAGSSRSDFFPSEDDTVLVQGVEGDANALGYFGFAYYLEEGEKLKGLEIDGGEGCVAPTADNVNNDTYPLSRPLFIYVSVPALEANPGLVSFVDFYLSDDARELIADTGYVVLPDEMYATERSDFENRSTQ